MNLTEQLPTAHRDATGTRPAEKSLSCHAEALSDTHTVYLNTTIFTAFT